jgi:ubiquinone biosynthesis accessory factor UbiJ
VSPFATLLTRWVETLANESANLDSLTRTRLRALAGRSIAIVVDPPGETTTLRFDDESIRLSPGAADAPSVIVRGAPMALAGAFLGGGARGGLSIDGDEVVLSQFRSIVRDFRPDVLSPLENLVGRDAAQSIANVFEVGLSALAAIGRSLGDEGTRLAKEGARQRYLTASEFDAFIGSMQALRIRFGRLAARTEIVERTTGAKP